MAAGIQDAGNGDARNGGKATGYSVTEPTDFQYKQITEKLTNSYKVSLMFKTGQQRSNSAA